MQTVAAIHEEFLAHMPGMEGHKSFCEELNLSDDQMQKLVDLKSQLEVDTASKKSDNVTAPNSLKKSATQQGKTSLQTTSKTISKAAPKTASSATLKTDVKSKPKTKGKTKAKTTVKTNNKTNNKSLNNKKKSAKAIMPKKTNPKTTNN